MRRLAAWPARIAAGGAVLLALALAAHAAGARINTTASIPVGLYWTSRAPLAKGVYVQACPPPGALFDSARQRGYIGAGFCPGGYGFLMKRVLAAKGERVSFDDDGVRVEGVLLPASAPVALDRAGRAMPRLRGERVLGEAEVLLMGEGSAASFDGRYFGPVSAARIVSVVQPVLVR